MCVCGLCFYIQCAEYQAMVLIGVISLNIAIGMYEASLMQAESGASVYVNIAL